MRTDSETRLPGAALVVLAALAILYLPWVGETLFNSKGEPREAIVAVSMLQSGNWILPLNYGGDIPYKPPFLAWLIAGAAWLFNGGVVNEYLSRLPSVLAAIAMVMAGFFWARRERGERFAVIYSFVTICSFEVFRAAMACRLDMVLTACMVISIYMLYNLCEHRGHHRKLRYAAVVALLSCATLTKGPVGSLLPCFAMGIYYLLRGRRFFPTLGLMLGLSALSLILPAWWSYEAFKVGGQHFVDLFMEENIGRLTGTMSYESHVNPWWYNFMTLAAGLLPWTLLCILALCANTRHLRRSPLKPAGLLSATVAIVVIAFYCIPDSKRSVYLLPAYPFLCYGITSMIETIASRKTMRGFAWLMAVLAIAVPAAFIAMHFYPVAKLPLAPTPWWGYAVLVVPVLCGCSWIAGRHSAVAHTTAIVWSLYLAYTATVMPAVLNPRSDSRILGELPEDGTVYSYSHMPNYRFYTLNYYLDDRMRHLDTPAEVSRLDEGSVVIIPTEADSAALSGEFECRRLLDRSCDHRHHLYLAVKKAPATHPAAATDSISAKPAISPAD